MKNKNQLVNIAGYILLAIFLRYVMVGVMDSESLLLWIVAIAVIFVVGIVFVFRGTANIIEETTDVLKDRTGLAGGFLQSSCPLWQQVSWRESLVVLAR